MKFRLLLIFLLMSGVVCGQYAWKEKYIFDGGNGSGEKVFFLTENEGFVVGYRSGLGTATYYTEDGGNSWDFKYMLIPYFSGLQDAFFVDTNTGFITDGYGLYKTVDRGETWRLILERRNTNIFYNIFFKDANNGLLASRGGLFSTTDGGETWSEMDQHISRLSINRETGEGYGLSGDEFYSTLDFGQTWKTEYFRAPDLPDYRLKEMIFIDHSGIAVVAYTAELSVARRDLYQRNGIKWEWDWVAGGYSGIVFSDDAIFTASNGKIYNIKRENSYYTLSPNDTHITSFCHINNVVYALSEKCYLYKYEDPNLTSVRQDAKNGLTIVQTDRKILLNLDHKLTGNYELIDMMGKIIKNERSIVLNNKEIEIDSPGIYLIRVQCEGGAAITKKIAIK